MGDLAARARTAALARCTLYALLDHHIFGPKGPSGGVTGSIPVAPTIKAPQNRHFLGGARPFFPAFRHEQRGSFPQKLGETFAECSSG
jgi:hypothetical protein